MRAPGLMQFLSGFGLLLAAAGGLAQPGATAVGSEQIGRLVEQHVHRALEGSAVAQGATAIEVRSGSLDSRLRLAACDSALDIDADLGRPNGRINAKVSCRGPAPWSIYVPLEIRVFREVVVTTQALERGQPIGADDVRLEERDMLASGGRMLLALEDAIGRTPRRSLPAHAALNAASIELPLLVRRGERVSLAARSGGITVTAAGEALTNGRDGEQIRVRNLQSQRVVQATVTGPGRAEVI